VDAVKKLLSVEAKWDILMESWFLILFDRQLRTHVGVDFLQHYLILHADVPYKAAMWRKQEHFGETRRPLIIEALGYWCVSTQQTLWYCGSLSQAMCCWSSNMMTSDFNGTTMTGKDLTPYIRELTTPCTIKACSVVEDH
jgi:hypothetical protein